MTIFNSKKLLLSLAALFSVLTIAALFHFSRESLIRFLSVSSRVNPELLVVEGWLPDPALKGAVEEINSNSYKLIITTGIKSSELDYCMMGMNGYFIFYPGLRIDPEKDSGIHTIEVVAKSKMGGNYSCHFNFFVNDSLIDHFTADEKSNKYGIEWFGALNDIDSLMIFFDNDMVDENGDRNLFIREIIIDSRITIPYQYNSVYDIGALDGRERIINNYETLAELARNKLVRYGIDSSKILPLAAQRPGLNRTLSSALAFRHGLEKANLKYTDFNIFSHGIHARRTWITYKRILDKSYNVGIIAFSDPVNMKSEELESAKIFAETLDLIYYWIILIPYFFF